MEDIAFNGLSFLNNKAIKFGNFYLRFGHYTMEDNNDRFYKHVIETDADFVSPIFGVYIMLYYYLIILNRNRFLVKNRGTSNQILNYAYNMVSNRGHEVPLVGPTSKNKYNWMHMFVYIMFNIDHIVTSDYVTRFTNTAQLDIDIKTFNDTINIEVDIIKLIDSDKLIVLADAYYQSYNDLKNFLIKCVKKYYKNQVDPIWQKYLKYKQKYLELKANII